MSSQQQNPKKRKTQEHLDEDAENSNTTNIDSILFNEMSLVNGQLISLAKKVKLVDHRYFLNNSSMIDEFVGNIHEFLQQVDIHRKKVSSDQLNSDNLFHIYQFVDLKSLVHSCQFVCKMWRETLLRVPLKVKLVPTRNRKKSKIDKELITSLLSGPLATNVVSLRLGEAGVDAFQAMATHFNKLESLKKLDLTGNNLGVQSVKHLKKCIPTRKGLTKLSLANVKKFTAKEAKELLTCASFMEGIKKLDLSTEEYTKEFFDAISGAKCLTQLTHLKLSQQCQSTETDYGLANFLKDKVNLESLNLNNHRLSLYPNLLTSGQFVNLTSLDLGYNHLSNEELVNIILSPNLPKLTTLSAKNFNWGNREEKEIIQIPQNATANSSLTELNLSGCSILPLCNITYVCPQLRNLTLSFSSSRYCENKAEMQKAYCTVLSAPTLSNLEILDVSDLFCLESLFEIIFTSPIYSNLQQLICTCCNADNITLSTDLVSKCTNLINLKRMQGTHVGVDGDCFNAFKTNPTFAKLKELSLGNNY